MMRQGFGQLGVGAGCLLHMDKCTSLGALCPSVPLQPCFASAQFQGGLGGYLEGVCCHILFRVILITKLKAQVVQNIDICCVQ